MRAFISGGTPATLLELWSHRISCTNTSRNPLCIQLYVYWYSIMALKSADSITSRIFQVNNIPYCNHVCRWGILVFWLLTCLHEVYWYIWPYFQNLRYIGMSTIVYEVNWMFPIYFVSAWCHRLCVHAKFSIVWCTSYVHDARNYCRPVLYIQSNQPYLYITVQIDLHT